MKPANALLIFLEPMTIHRRNNSEGYGDLTWRDLDVFYNMMLDDVVAGALQLLNTDVYTDLNNVQTSDEFENRFLTRMNILPSTGGSLTERVHRGIEMAYSQQYQRVIVLLKIHPLIHRDVLERIFGMLTCEEDCLVVTPTDEGKYLLVGMKSNHSDLFLPSGSQGSDDASWLHDRISRSDASIFPTPTLYTLNSGQNLERLKDEVDRIDGKQRSLVHRTHEAFNDLQLNHRSRKIFR